MESVDPSLWAERDGLAGWLAVGQGLRWQWLKVEGCDGCFDRLAMLMSLNP